MAKISIHGGGGSAKILGFSVKSGKSASYSHKRKRRKILGHSVRI